MRLRDLRLEAGYTDTAALARAVGRSKRQLRRIEAGDSPVPRWLWRLLQREAGIVVTHAS
jgi:transcriptional regulator with XRE-family HTH domain